ncbi:MAG TPA: uroporphyrinogen decarboxylase family protein [Planctomycetota bacterium]|jgi:hypothetical protein
MTPREIVRRTLKFETPERIARDLWVLPRAREQHPAEVAQIEARFPSDLTGAPSVYRPSARVRGNAYAKGEHIDEWGCCFTNLQSGIIGEVRKPLIAEASDWRQLQPPYETLPENKADALEKIKRAYGETEKFMMGGCCPRPWERYQFLRGSENAMIDMAVRDDDVRALLKRIHEFYLAEYAFWADSCVDALSFMDDWGSQRALLISPAVWRELFKPLYREYCQIAHSHGKSIFMHSDGHIAAVYDDLIEIGVDAVNSQLFCMDMADLEQRARGKITFWGEIDRQHVLPSPNPQDGRDAVRKAARHFYDTRGGVIAQYELSAESNPAVGMAIFEEWEKVDRERRAAPDGETGGRGDGAKQQRDRK